MGVHIDAHITCDHKRVARIVPLRYARARGKGTYGVRQLSLVTHQEYLNMTTRMSARELAAALPGAIRVDGELRLTCAQEDKLPLLARITGFGDKVADIEVLPPSLEDIYSHFSKRDGQ